MSTAKRIVFVDDEARVLSSLRNLLHRERHRWDLAFCATGPAALAELDRCGADVVVSDVKVRGMDGVDFLEQVRQSHPEATRIVLSGDGERDALIRANHVTHQVLPKPCGVEVLVSTLERACALQDLVDNPKARELAGRMDRVPSPPRAYWDLAAAAAQPSTSMADLAAIVERDPASSAKVLQLVNSAYFGLARRVTSVSQAVTLLGVELLKGLVLSTHVFSQLRTVAPRAGFSVEGVVAGALRVARVAKRLPKTREQAELAFTTALLKDLGLIVMLDSLPEQLAHAAELSREENVSLVEAERRVFGVTHLELGAYLLGVWGLALTIVEGTAYHQRPSALAGARSQVLGAVHVAWALASEGGSEQPLDQEYLRAAKLEGSLDRWREAAGEELAQLGNAA